MKPCPHCDETFADEASWLAHQQDHSAMEALLADLRSAGTTDSAGNFSLDLERTLEKLSRFQLAEPQNYPLNAVASATLGGASFIHAYCDADNTVLVDDAPPLSRTDLSELFHSLFESGRERKRLQELAIAVNAARSMDPRFIIVDSWSGDRGHRLQIAAGQLQIAPLLTRPWKESQVVNRLHVRERMGPRTLRKFAGSKPEVEALLRRCGLGPSPLWVNGTRAGPELDKLDLLAMVTFESPRELRALPLEAPLRHRVQAPFGGAMGLAACPSPERTQWLHVVVHGVTFSLPFEDRFPPGWRAWIEAPYLTKDLSQGSLVRNQAFDDLLARLDQECQAMVVRLGRATELNPAAGPRTAPALGWLLQRLRDDPQIGDIGLFCLADGTPLPFSELVKQTLRRASLPVSIGPCEPGGGVLPDGGRVVRGGGWEGQLLQALFPNQFVEVACNGPLTAPLAGGPTLLGKDYLARLAVHGDPTVGKGLYANVPPPPTQLGQIGLPRRAPGDFFRVTLYARGGLLLDKAMPLSLEFPFPKGVEVVLDLPGPAPRGNIDPALPGLLRGAVGCLKELYRQLAWPAIQDDPASRALSLDHVLACLERASLEHGQISDPALLQLYPSPYEAVMTARSLEHPKNPLGKLVAMLDLDLLLELKVLPSQDGSCLSVRDLGRSPRPVFVSRQQDEILQSFLPTGCVLTHNQRQVLDIMTQGEPGSGPTNQP